MSAGAVKPAPTVAIRKVAQNARLTGLCLAVADTTAVVLAAVGFAGVRLGYSWSSSLAPEFLPGLGTLLVFALLGVYPVVGLNPALECRRILLGSALGYALGSVPAFLQQTAPLAALGTSICAWVATVLLIFTCRGICRQLFCHLAWWGTPTVLFGSGPAARAVFRALQCHRGTCLKIVALFDDDLIDWPELDRTRVHVGTLPYAAEFAAKTGVSDAIIAMPALSGAQMGDVVKTHASPFRHVLVIPGLSGLASVRVEASALGGMLGLHVTQTLLHREPQLIKRALDLIVTAIAGLSMLPLFALICPAVWVSSRGSVFYGHARIGRARSTFTAWKFRTMYAGADQILSAYLETDGKLRREWELHHKLKNDPRVTLIGRILRKTSLDELPQLWNVLAGEMSFVGPRPIVAAEIARYRDSFEAYSSVRPGITGLWQVSGRNNTTYDERVQLDEYYVRNWSVWLDLYILGRTVRTVLVGDGAY